MFLGAVSYPVLVASFFYLNDYLYYSASALLGLGAAILWSAQVSLGAILMPRPQRLTPPVTATITKLIKSLVCSMVPP